MKPLLAHIYEPHRVTYPCYVQPKLNGIRALYQNGHFQSRDQIPFTAGLLDHLSRPLLGVFPPETILDGELYVHGWPLQRINAAVTPVRQTPTEDTLQVEYHVFDVVDFKTPFVERRGVQETRSYQQLKNTPIKWVHTTQNDKPENADCMYTYFVSLGYEGIMYRLGDCPYTVPKQEFYNGLRFPASRSRFLSDKNNRAWHLLKRKDWQDDEFEFVSLNSTVGEKGERGFQMWCKTKSNKLFKVSSGLSQSELDHYLSNPPVGKQIKVKYLVLSSDGIPLNATILAIL